MTARETSRLHLPYPGLDDQGTWDSTFASMMAQIDARIFANLENLKPAFKELPTVTNDLVLRELQQSGDWVIVSRTFNVAITVPTGSTLALLPEAMLGVRITAGAVAAQTSAWEVFEAADIDAEVQVFGYVDASYNIIWWNGTVLAPGDMARLFLDPVGGGGGGDTVKVTGADPLAGYLNSKVVAGTNVTTAVLPPGMFGETLEISAAGPGDVLTGAGNPNGVTPGNIGQVYKDTAAVLFYVNVDGATVWHVF